MAHGASNSDKVSNELNDSSESGMQDDSSPTSAPQTLLAEVFISHERLVLVPTLESTSELSVQIEGTPVADGSFHFVSVFGTDFSSFERSLEADTTVNEAILFSTSGDRRTYRIRPSPDTLPLLPTANDLGIRTLDIQSGNGGWVVRIQLLSRESLIDLRKACLEIGTTFHVRQLYDSDSNTDIDSTRLTERQRDTVLTAYRSGYYNVPRGISQGELAEELDVSTSAISQQLRRATRQLIASTFVVDED